MLDVDVCLCNLGRKTTSSTSSSQMIIGVLLEPTVLTVSTVSIVSPVNVLNQNIH